MERPQPETRTFAVRLPRDYHRAIRKISAEHDLRNIDIICWALDLLIRYEADGGTYGQ